MPRTSHIFELTALICTLFLLSGYKARGQDADYLYYENISLGAGASAVNCFLQDGQGMVWIGSDKGLLSYDGYSVRQHFTLGDWSNSHINCGVVADSTRFYLGTDTGLLIYNYKTDSYEKLGEDSPSGIRSMVLDGGTLWLGTLNGLFSYDTDSHTYTPDAKPLPHQAVYSLIRATDGCLYIGTYNGYCRYVPDTGQIEPIPLPMSENKSNLFVNSQLEDIERQCIWIGTEGCLLKYSPSTSQVVQIDALRGNSVKALALDSQERLLAGTDNGLYIYSESAEVRHIIHDSRDPHSLSDNVVWGIFTGQGQNAWLGTNYGVSLAQCGSELKHISLSQVTGIGESNRFYSILRDGDSNFWLGGTNGLLRFARGGADRDGGKWNFGAWYQMGDKTHPLSHNCVHELYEDSDGELWLASDGGVGRYDRRTGQFSFYNIVDSSGKYNANWAYSLIEDTKGRLWIATCQGGIFVVDRKALMRTPAGGTYVADKSYTTQNGLSGMFAHAFATDSEGNIWALLFDSPNSIEKINPSTDEITHIAPGRLQGETVPNSILRSEDGEMWIGYNGGIMIADVTGEKTQILTFDTFDNCEVLAMAQTEGRVWISTSNGLWESDIQTPELHRISVTDGRFTALYFDPDEKLLYMSVSDGFMVSEPEALLKGHKERPIVFTSFLVNNRPHPLPQSIRYTNQITLTHDQNNLTFEASDLSYSVEGKSRLLYRLEKYDKEWNHLAQGTNRITYRNLKYGRYRLNVSQLDMFSRPSENIYSLSIRIRPPFYYTPVAKCLYILMALAIILLFVRFFRVRNRLRMEQLEKERLLEQTRAKMEFFANLSHDLKTPLSMIIAPVSKMLPSMRDGADKKQLEMVHRNAMKLNSLIHQGLDFQQIDGGGNALLILSQIELVSFARNILSLYEEGKMKEKGLNAVFSSDKEEVYVYMDAVKLESILDNLLSNAVKYTPDGGTVTLALSVNGRDVTISVADTGIGIPAQDQPYIFQRFFQSSRTAGKKEGTGIGLYLVKTYTELHGGDVTLDSKENEGTTITVHLPGICVEQTISNGKSDGQDSPFVLIVEDDADVADFISQLLHNKHRTRVVRNGKEGLEAATELLPDLIVSDVRMPVMNGLEMVRQLKKNLPTSTIPIILLTAQGDKDTELESLQLNIDAFIAKPFEPSILLSRVEQLLHNRQVYEAKARMDALTEPKKPDEVSSDEKFLANVIRLVEEHISDSDLNVNALCGWTATTNKQMYRKIKQLTGMTPVSYIKSIRMKKAAMLLKQQKFTVAEVMYLVGFSNHSYFSKCFYDEFGVTPKQYLG
ncbi:MAG: ATP-binding protein [Bacteroidales bacterium]|nr:ATP-binding protein [Bacteroidales bacterium]